MSGMWQQSDEMESSLKSAALRVHFGEAESEPEPSILSFPGRPTEQSSRLSRRSDSLGVILSTIIHAGLFLISAFVVTDLGETLNTLLEREAINAAFSDREEIDDQPLVPEGPVIVLEQSSGPAAKKSALPSSVTEITPNAMEKVTITPEEFVATLGEDGEQKEAQGTGGVEQFRYQKPDGGRAVTKGSFTVWTEPLDPIPNQPYMIVVQFRVPEGLESFPKSDLKIDVVGTDTFHLRLPDPRRGFKLIGELPVIDGQTQLIIPIPGAPSLVRDAIRIESRKVLREQQSLLIEF